MAKPTSTGPGRPSLFTDHVRSVILNGFALGLRTIEAAVIVGVDPATVYNWRRRYPDFDDECQSAIEIARHSVEAARLTSQLRLQDRITDPLERPQSKLRAIMSTLTEPGGGEAITDSLHSLSADDQRATLAVMEERLIANYDPFMLELLNRLREELEGRR